MCKVTPYLRNQDGSVHVVLIILCDHTVMSQEHKILPGTVVHLCFSRGKSWKEGCSIS